MKFISLTNTKKLNYYLQKKSYNKNLIIINAIFFQLKLEYIIKKLLIMKIKDSVCIIFHFYI